ncbi:MAG: hypothetical protein ACJ72N_12550 [Labedaea sp.]
MSTHAQSPASAKPRVWLVAGAAATPDPTDLPTVRDNRMITWLAGADGRYHSADGRHHATWSELHARFDLVEVAEVPAAA